MNIKAILVGVALFGAAADAGAAMSVAFSTMTYQGRLKESGSSVTGNRDVRIYICNAFTGGLCFSDTPAQSVAVADGVFKTTFTLPGGVDLAAGNWFLEASVGPVGGGLTTLSPREKLTSSAYAVASAMSLDANSVPAEGVAPGILGTGVNFADKVGIGTVSPSALLHLNAGAASAGVHLKATQTTAPTVGVPASCGGSPGASILAGSTDMAGRLTITSGSLSPTTCDTVITFRQPLGAAPKAVLFTAATSTASYRNIYVSNMGSGADFTVSFSSNPPASVGMDWSYFVIE